MPPTTTSATHMPLQRHLLVLPCSIPSVSDTSTPFRDFLSTFPRSSVLTIALTTARPLSFSSASKRLAAVYGRIHDICGSEKKDSSNIRVVFALHGREEETRLGPICALAGLLKGDWTTVHAVDGDDALSSFKGNVDWLPRPAEMLDACTVSDERKEEYDVVAVGGTFDHLHLGHKLLLSMTSYLLSPRARLIIGISGPAMLVNKAYANQMESWEVRETAVIEFLTDVMVPESVKKEEGMGWVFKSGTQEVLVEVSELLDPFGPTITVEECEALVVTEETAKGGEAVNSKRREKSWKELEVYTVGLIRAEAEEEKLSSSSLRKLESRQRNKLSAEP